MDDVNIDQ
jgi:hypothetical protein